MLRALQTIVRRLHFLKGNEEPLRVLRPICIYSKDYIWSSMAKIMEGKKTRLKELQDSIHRIHNPGRKW